jgi:C4-dicarboxylate-specific signal transduction histidine kinase
MAQVEKNFRSIRNKLLFTILFVSTFLSTFITFVHFYREYLQEVSNLDRVVHNLIDSSLPSVTRTLWNLDEEQMALQIDSMLKVADIVKVKVITDKNKVYYQVEKKIYDVDDKFILSSELKIERQGEWRSIGTIEIHATEKNIREEIYANVIFFLISQFLKTIFISMVILMVVRHFLTKYIHEISIFMKNYNFSSTTANKLTLERKHVYRDEIDELIDSLNIFIEKLAEANEIKNQRIYDQEKEIQVQKAASINQARLASLGEMAASIAHEINNPLTVLAFSGKKLEQLAMSKTFDPDRLLHFTSKVNKTIERMVKTIQGLKRLGRDADNDEMSPVKIKEVVSNVLDLCQVSLTSKGIEVKIDFNDIDENLVINCREVQVMQILLNLLNNAVDVVKDLDQPWINLDIKLKNEIISFSIIDCGKGISEEIEHKMFQPFFTTKDIGEGTGLGLSISAQMAKEHKGKLYVDRSLKEHTKMTLDLPLDPSIIKDQTS